MSRLTRDGTAEPVSRDQILRHARGQGNIHFPCSADHEQDWQPYPFDPYSAICDDHTYIHTYLEVYWPCTGGLPAVKAIGGTQLRDPINSGLTEWRLAVLNIIMDAAAESGGIPYVSTRFSLSME